MKMPNADLARVERQKVADYLLNAMASPHGEKYILDGQMESPSERNPLVRTIWIMDAGQDRPRLVTAYPRED